VPDVTIVSPTSGREVPWNFPAYGTTVNGVTLVRLVFDYEWNNGGVWTPDQIVGNTVPFMSGGEKIWEANIGVAKDGKNGVLTAYNAAPADGGKVDNLTIKQDPGIGYYTQQRTEQWVKATGAGAGYSEIGTYDKTLGGTQVVGTVTPYTKPQNIVKIVTAAANDGIWMMLFGPPPGAPPYALTPYLLDGKGNTKAVGLPRKLT
jgi:hypothetical protein